MIATKPEEAARALGAIEVIARSALTETRYLLGVLREQDGSPPALLPSPGIANLQALADQVIRQASRSLFGSKASRGRCHPASGCLPTGSSRRH